MSYHLDSSWVSLTQQMIEARWLAVGVSDYESAVPDVVDRIADEQLLFARWMDNVFAFYLCVWGSNSVVLLLLEKKQAYLLLLLSDATCKERLPGVYIAVIMQLKYRVKFMTISNHYY